MVITLLDDAGQLQDFLASGLTREQSRRLWELPDGMTIFQAVSNIQDPMRLRDFHSNLKALGLPEFRPPMPVSSVLTLLAAPLRHRGEAVGNICLGETNGGREYTQEDEATLVMFASQAALVIANARRYRDEQRARADLEALINTSPVGVAVFDTGTGALVSFNRETARILEGLWINDGNPEDLLEVVTIRRADGREVSLQELSMAQALSPGEPVRAEEFVFQVPDGRKVTALVNATPIRTDDGRMESCVVTLQDMKPLEELKRLRAEFLAMVSHELRAPLAAIKGSAATVLDDDSPLGTAEMVQFFRIINQQADQMGGLINDLLDVARIQTGTLVVDPEPETVTGLVEQARNTFLNGWSNYNLHMELAPDLPSARGPRTTSSSPSRPRSWQPGSGRLCGSRRHPVRHSRWNPLCLEI